MYVCMSHIGSHHVLALIIALKGYRVAGVRDPNEGTLRRYVQRKYEETFPEFKGKQFQEIYQQACKLVAYEGAEHGFFNPQNAGGKWYRETLLEVDRFLTALGYLPGPAPSSIP